MEYKRVKLTKVGLTGRIPDGLHPNGIEVGYIEEGQTGVQSHIEYGTDKRSE